ncbi:hypothetical protein EGW08_005528 [Elysia chlorotica]|uniref:Uncharacterized protein n=1 Tax=Elysia chlorotica TaxID=188477 RepID=A0A3S1C9P6_ELYCH|nr:hypothetical protein EGW08_005528 [Elysia chlorotica]
MLVFLSFSFYKSYHWYWLFFVLHFILMYCLNKGFNFFSEFILNHKLFCHSLPKYFYIFLLLLLTIMITLSLHNNMSQLDVMRFSCCCFFCCCFLTIFYTFSQIPMYL